MSHGIPEPWEAWDALCDREERERRREMRDATCGSCGKCRVPDGCFANPDRIGFCVEYDEYTYLDDRPADTGCEEYER